MIPLEYLVLIFFVALGFILVLLNKDKIAIEILVFTIPFAAHPFTDAKFPILLGLNGFLIIGIWLAQTIKKNLFHTQSTKWTVISKKVKYLYYFLIGGILLAFLKSDYSNFNLGRYTPFESIINYSLSILCLILFIKIMVSYRYDFNFQDKLMAVFILTSFLQFGSFLFNYIGYGHLLPKFLVTSAEFSETYYRFSGLLGDYELIVDYTMVVIGFASILVVKRKYMFLSIASITISLLMGILSGTRSFFVIISIYLIIITFLFVIKFHMYQKIFKFVTIIFSASMLIYYLIQNFIPSYTIFMRFNKSIEYIREGNITGAVNRNLIEALPIVVRNSGFLGNGSLLIYQIEGDGMVYHNLYYAIYANFGIIGIIILLSLVISSILILYKIMKKTNEKRIAQESVILFALIISLFIQQIKISATRYVSSILIYAFVFFVVYFCRLKFMKKNE